MIGENLVSVLNGDIDFIKLGFTDFEVYPDEESDGGYNFIVGRFGRYKTTLSFHGKNQLKGQSDVTSIKVECVLSSGGWRISKSIVITDALIDQKGFGEDYVLRLVRKLVVELNDEELKRVLF